MNGMQFMEICNPIAWTDIKLNESGNTQIYEIYDHKALWNNVLSSQLLLIQVLLEALKILIK